MTIGVIQRSAGHLPGSAVITQVKQSAILGDDLFLQLGIQLPKHGDTRTEVLRVPFKDIGLLGPSESAIPLDVDELRFAPPTVGYWVPEGVIPTGATPVYPEYIDVASSQALDERLTSLASGVHVVIAPLFHFQWDRLTQPPPHDGLVPAGGQVILAIRIEGVPGADSDLFSFNVARKKNRAWLLLTPLTVVGDIVTFPIQLFIISRGDL